MHIASFRKHVGKGKPELRQKARIENLVSLDLQREILRRVMIAMAFGATLVVVLAIIRTVMEGFQPKFLAMWLVSAAIYVLTIFYRRLNLLQIGLSLYGMFTAIGFVAFLNTGIASIGAIFLFIALSMASMVVEFRRLLLLVGLQLGLFAGLVGLLAAGWIAPLPENGLDYLTSPSTWVFHGIVIAIGGVISFYGTSVLGSWYKLSLDQSRQRFFHGVAVMSLAHDTETGQHIDRVSLYAGEALSWLRSGVRAKEITFTEEELFNAVKLHDVGKISIPDVILKKQGKLDEQEFETIKGHTVLGANIISAMIERTSGIDRSTMLLARDIALYHHENWAGTGYPEGRRDLEIPLSARIMSLCDVYDALRSERPYKRAWTHEETVAKMLSMTEKFDPVLLEAFAVRHQRFNDIFTTSEGET